MIGIPIGLALANAGEWAIHRYVLHGLGRSRSSFWSFHWHEHHRNCRQNDSLDPCYRRPLTRWNAQSKEALALAAGTAAFLPLFPVAPLFVGTIAYCAVNYYRKHKRAHLDPGWAREHLPWHYDHHMGPNQHANWCVTRPWFDHVMGTRVPYAGTEREARDRARRAARRRARDGASAAAAQRGAVAARRGAPAARRGAPAAAAAPGGAAAAAAQSGSAAP
ncbi:MAG TPA: sterol desaturase family protein [Kofleriaceae bacterium]|nr:sterol desaturase family protein [Kofleriaceae bacterium]